MRGGQAQPSRLRSEAWLLRGISSVPGHLALTPDRLTFIADGPGTAWRWQLRKLERHLRTPGLAARIDAAKTILVLDAPLAELSVTFPWYYFSGGLKVGYRDASLRFSFGRPPNTAEGRRGVAAGLHEITSMRSVGKAWSAALQRHPGSR